jgi:magnesium transporter
MITILKSTDIGLETVGTLEDNVWVYLVDPSPVDIALLHDETGIPESFLTAASDANELPRTEHKGDATLIVLRVPHRNDPGTPIPYSTVPLCIILTKKLVVTVCSIESDITKHMAEGEVENLSTLKRHRFVLQLFFNAASHYLEYLGYINAMSDSLEQRLSKSLQNREVLELLKYQKCLTYFTTGLKANALMIERLQKGKLFEQVPEDAELLEDVLTEIAQAIEMTSIASGILSQMMDAYASIISNNLNVVMKFLASATIILALPTLVASIYGMNIDLPLQESPFAFHILMGVSALLSIMIVVVFIRRNWF